MTPTELKAAREQYGYVPARLVPAPDGVAPAIHWNALKLSMDVPISWRSENSEARSNYSSFALDTFHYELLQSESDDDLLNGLMSIIFWGFASGTNGRINAQRALSRSRAILEGRSNAPPEPVCDIISHLRRCRELLRASKLDEALLEAIRIKYLQMSFASKLLTFMAPQVAAVYDEVISLRLEKQSDPELRSLFVSTAMPTSRRARISQAKAYEGWCCWCSNKASVLNALGFSWVDWDATEHRWRAVDVERAFFALGR